MLFHKANGSIRSVNRSIELRPTNPAKSSDSAPDQNGKMRQKISLLDGPGKFARSSLHTFLKSRNFRGKKFDASFDQATSLYGMGMFLP